MLKKPVTVMEYYSYFISQQERLIFKSKTFSTVRTYKVRGKILESFLSSYGLLECKPKDINIQLVREYETWLKGERSYSNDYAMKSIQLLSKIMRLSLENGDIRTNPVDLYDYRYERNKNIVFLDLEEITLLKNTPMAKSLTIVRDAFLFGCFTGLCYIDMKNFNSKSNIVKGVDKKEWIYLKRKKTNSDTYVPLLPETEMLLKKYNYSIPVYANKSMNIALKKIARICKINKPLSTHVARKTFGNILHNELNVPIETVSRMMGHRSVKTTESWYVQTNVKKIMHDMKGITFFNVA